MILGAQPPVDTLPRFLQPQTDKNGRFNTAPQEDATVATASSSGFVEPVTGKQRRVPLEILRTRKPGEPGVNLVYSAARNSAVSEGTRMLYIFEITTGSCTKVTYCFNSLGIH